MNEEGEPMSQPKKLLLALGVVLLTVLGSVSVAEAQGYPPPYYPPPPPPPPPRGVFRAGIVWGFAVGLGDVNSGTCPNAGNACGGAFVLEGHLGGMISPRAALMFEGWGADHPYSFGGNDHETINSFWTGAAQYWVTYNFWVKGGAGVAVLRETQDAGFDVYGNPIVAEQDHTGFALFGAAGIELLQSYNFALDIQGRIGNGFYNDNGPFSVQNYAVLIGFNWY
jgi:hypothetical protein